MLEEGIKARLSAFEEVSDIVADNIFPMVLPTENSIPALVYQGISVQPVLGISGQNALQKKRLQVDCYGKTYAEVKLLERAVMHCLVNFQGTLEDSDSTYVDAIYLNNTVDLYESEAQLYRVSIDFDVWFITT